MEYGGNISPRGGRTGVRMYLYQLQDTALTTVAQANTLVYRNGYWVNEPRNTFTEPVSMQSLTVSSTSTLTGAVTIGSTLSVAGTLTAAGTINAATVTATGTVSGSQVNATNAAVSVYLYAAELETAGFQMASSSGIELLNNTYLWRSSTESDPAASTTPRTVIGTSGGANLMLISRSAAATLILQRSTTTGNIANFYYGATQVGTISVTGSATAYNQSSDYRLKNNVVELTNASERLQRLRPVNFTFINDIEAGVYDGFLAHEVAEVVPHAVTGEKDAVDEDGNPEYQGIDHSKLVPLLTAALQEALAELSELKQRVTVLEQR